MTWVKNGRAGRVKREKHSRTAKHERLRFEIARIAAQLLFDEEVRRYQEARGQAVHRVCPGASVERGAHLPEYSEIHAELRQLFLLHGGEGLATRVRICRQLALKYLLLFDPFEPLLVGSVARGEVRGISDINLHLFSDRPEDVTDFLRAQEREFDEAGDAESTCVFLEEEGVEIACRIYPQAERRQRPGCRITGEPQARLGAAQLKGLLELEK